MFKRQTALITKKVSNLTNKLINPFTKVKTSNPRLTIDDIKVTPGQIVIKNHSIKLDNDEHRKESTSTMDSDIRSESNGKEILIDIDDEEIRVGSRSTSTNASS